MSSQRSIFAWHACSQPSTTRRPTACSSSLWMMAQEPPRQICAGIKGHYPREDLPGRLIIIVANLEPRVIRGEESRGMLLAASNIPRMPPRRRRKSGKSSCLRPDADIQPGSIVS